jgi:hypothetical protein
MAGLFGGTILFMNSAQAQTLIEALPDGSYRFCQSIPSQTQPDVGDCFLFQKTNNLVTGDFYRASTGEGICITGAIEKNTISGGALEYLHQGNLPGAEDAGKGIDPRSDPLSLGGGELVNPSFSATQGSSAEGIRWRRALLVLDTFQQYNIETRQPPQQCPLSSQ